MKIENHFHIGTVSEESTLLNYYFFTIYFSTKFTINIEQKSNKIRFIRLYRVYINVAHETNKLRSQLESSEEKIEILFIFVFFMEVFQRYIHMP